MAQVKTPLGDADGLVLIDSATGLPYVASGGGGGGGGEAPLVQEVYNQAGVIPINTDLMVIDCSLYRSLSIQCISMGTSGVVTPAWSNNGVDYPAGAQLMTLTSTAVPSFNSTGLWTVNVYGRYLRLRLTTATTAGTTSINVQGFQTPISQPAGQTVTASGAVAVTAISGSSGTPAAPATPYILNSVAGTNAALIATGSSGLHAFYATNTGATTEYVKLYNKATSPVVGTDIPAMIIPVPVAVSGVPGVATLPIGNQGFRFPLGLGIAITGEAADTDTTAVAANQIKVILSRTV